MSPQQGSPTKKPFAPSTSTRAPFTRHDSRGEYQLQAATSDEVHAKLQSLGMRTRMAVNRGYDPALPLSNISTSNANNASLEGSSRSVWSRVHSAPHHSKELQPFGYTGDISTSPSFPFGPSGGILEEDVGMSASCGAHALSTASKKRGNVEDVLGEFMSDEEEEEGSIGEENVDLSISKEGEDIAMSTDDRICNPLRPIKTLPSSAINNSNNNHNNSSSTNSTPTNPFPRRTFTQAQTLPASMHTSGYLANAGNLPTSASATATAAEDPEGDAKWKAIRFEQFIQQQTDF